MTLLNEDLHDEKLKANEDEETKDLKVAQLKELSATDQADTTFSGDTTVSKEENLLPEPQGNQDQMWAEYDQWKSIGKA